MDPDVKIQVAEKNLDRLLEWINRFDNKSTIILGIDTGMLGYLGSSAPSVQTWTISIILLVILAVGALLLSLLYVYFGIYPRTKGPQDSLIYFGSIVKKSVDEYKQAFSGQNDDGYLTDLLEQCHRNSEILDQKFDCLKKAYRLLLISVLPWALALYFFKYI